jgi:hypothetical protein
VTHRPMGLDSQDEVAAGDYHYHMTSVGVLGLPALGVHYDTRSVQWSLGRRADCESSDLTSNEYISSGKRHHLPIYNPSLFDSSTQTTRDIILYGHTEFSRKCCILDSRDPDYAQANWYSKQPNRQSCSPEINIPLFQSWDLSRT